MRSFVQGATRTQRESVAAGNDPKGEARSASILPPPPLLPEILKTCYSELICPMAPRLPDLKYPPLKFG